MQKKTPTKKKEPKVRKRSVLEVLFEGQLRLAGAPVPVLEFIFHPTRKWRFDFAYPDLLVAIEVEGATWVAGRHTRGSGYEKDAEKYGEAAILGWRVLKVTSSMIKNGMALDLTLRLLESCTHGRKRITIAAKKGKDL